LAKNIEKIPLNDRPYEKMELFGSENLTNSELLAIIIKTGTVKNSCLEIAQKILKKNESIDEMSDLEYLSSISVEELKSYDGIGRVKALQIKAVIELSKRLSNIYVKQKDKIVSPKDVFNMLNSKYLGQKQECLKTILLNKKNNVISIVTNAIGKSDRIDIGLKEVFCEPIKQMANSIILVHNHPSGSLIPSKQDIAFTNTVYEYSKIFNIELLDHIIIGSDKYISLKEEKYI
jgi:DNA repair protein RadC